MQHWTGGRGLGTEGAGQLAEMDLTLGSIQALLKQEQGDFPQRWSKPI